MLYKTLWKRKTPLMVAAETGSVLAVSTCLWASEQALGPRYQSYLNDAASSGNTALMLACKRGHAGAVRVLLEEGASPLPANRRGQTAVHLAAVRSHVVCLELVLEAPVRALGGGTPLAAMAVIRDNAGETRFIDAHDRAGFTALHLAAIHRATASVGILVTSGAALDVPVLRGMERLPFLCGGSTPLHIAAAHGDVRTCLVLLEGQVRHPGLELRRVRNMLGLTPLNCALLGGHHEVVRILVDPGRRPRGRGRGWNSGSGGSGGGDLPRMVSLDASFPESLRHHMLAVLQRAALLLQLRAIAGGWRDAGAARASDGAAAALPGLDSLSLEHVERMRDLLHRRDASLRDVLCGLEATLNRARSSGSGAVAAAGAEEGSDEFSSAASTPTAAVAASASVDWTLVGRSAELGRLSPAGLGAGGLSHRRRRDRRRAQTAASRGGSGRQAGEPASPRLTAASLEQTLSDIAGGVGGRVGIDGPLPLLTVPSSPGGEVYMDAREDAFAEEQGQQASQQQEGAEIVPKGGPTRVGVGDGDGDGADDCAICMDDAAEVCFAPCDHSVCFSCACKLCCRNGECIICPFCRSPVSSVAALAGARGGALAVVAAT